MPENHYTIRTMKREEIDIAIDWAAEEGWNPGLNDAGCYYHADPDGFLIGLLDDEPIATISVIRYGKSFGFLGFYIVKPEYRGKGYGIQIWEKGLAYLEGRNIGLDGVVEQQDNYKKSGFQLAHCNIRYEGRGGGKSPDAGYITELSELPFNIIESYDRRFFPEDRSRFLKYWISQRGSKSAAIIQDGHITGYGVIRPCRKGYKTGPLFADTPDAAEMIFSHLKSKVNSTDPVFLDVPAVNQHAVAMAEKHSMEISFETARMYTIEQPQMQLKGIFGITSFEIG